MDAADLPIFDADNHFYEPTDAFTRHLDPAMRKRPMQRAEVDGKTRLLVGGKANRFIPDPALAAVSKPGVLADHGLVDALGAAHVVFGSDRPHVEGLAEPRDFVKEIASSPDADTRRIMRDNARGLVTPKAG